MRRTFLPISFALLCFPGTTLRSQPPPAVRVRDAEGLRRAVRQAGPGTRILIEPGEYSGGFMFAGLRGAPGKPVVLAASDPENRPVFRGGGSAFHLSDPQHVEIENLRIAGMSGNGLNIDDGGSYETPAHHVVLRGISVSDVGPGGNHDGIKLSGVDDFRIDSSTIERWGTGGGSAIDMVGCHRGVIEASVFRHTDATSSTGIQAKGGSSGIVVRGNRFESAGGRAVNIGGSTGLAYFRPPLGAPAAPSAERWEARDIRVEGNTFIGGGAAVAFVGVDGAVVRFNTIYRPRRWALRILQENVEPGFVPSRNGQFTDNIVAFRAGELSAAANVGPRTAPETFRFERNFWYCLDDPAKSRPALPGPESDATHGQDPMFRDAEKGDLRLRPESSAKRAGAEALRG